MNETFLGKFFNKIFNKRRRLFLKYNDREYEIEYTKIPFWHQDKITIKNLTHKLTTNSWWANQIFRNEKTGGYSSINCMGNGSGIMHGFFVKNKMKKQLLRVAKYWDRVGREELNSQPDYNPRREI